MGGALLLEAGAALAAWAWSLLAPASATLGPIVTTVWSGSPWLRRSGPGWARGVAAPDRMQPQGSV